MIENLYMHVNGGVLQIMPPVDRPWKDNIRCQIFCQNQEEYDYLSALNLMHGRDIEIHIWDEWLKSKTTFWEYDSAKAESTFVQRRPRVLPIAYTTWFCNLRGL